MFEDVTPDNSDAHTSDADNDADDTDDTDDETIKQSSGDESGFGEATEGLDSDFDNVSIFFILFTYIETIFSYWKKCFNIPYLLAIYLYSYPAIYIHVGHTKNYLFLTLYVLCIYYYYYYFYYYHTYFIILSVFYICFRLENREWVLHQLKRKQRKRRRTRHLFD